MKINELITDFKVFTTIEEERVLEQLTHARPFNSFSEREQFTIEGLIRKSLVIKIGDTHPRVIANEL
jgi:hypothetical protein